MPTHRSIQSVRTFDALLHYLEEELDWPINEMDVDDLTFDYEPEELGLNPKIAAKIKSIKQLRPLTAGQPFGIFFVEFEPKRLPVTVLRRILGSLVTKKRESANPADRQSWNQDDLIFVSAFGELETRRIDFAHFADDALNGLPTLRVLGWDQQDTERKVEWVDNQLREHLSWDDEEPVDDWRQRWRSAFVLRHREVITTTKELAKRLAELAQAIRQRVRGVLAVESDTGPIRKLHKAFQDSLIHDLDDDAFADMYAQTISYGLLSARMSRPAGLVADDAALMIPNTNPFLRDLMEEFLRIGGRDKKAASGTGIDFDELGVNDVVELLRDANIKAVIADFGRTRPGEDPVIHFYEDFMRIYDKKQKVSRGVFYTPQPVVSFIVRSVDEILRDEFSLPLGLADTTTWGEMAERFPPSPTGNDVDASSSEPSPPGRGQGEGPGSSGITIPPGVSPDTPFVQILDPATGTGTFLVEVIDLIHKRMRDHWLTQGHMPLEIDTLWNEYVPEHLLPRLYGYELLMAPYTIAHMKIGLKLSDTGYTFQSEQRLRVFLTNSLEPPMDLSEMLEFVAPFLAHEARAANKIKRDQRFTVVIGNPPYAALSTNRGEWITTLTRSTYYPRDGHREANPKLLLDDYVKFLRLFQFIMDRTRVAVLGVITNHGYLDSPTFRAVRSHLSGNTELLYILNLHGNSRKGEVSPDGTPDENVFDIAQGVSILLCTVGIGQSCSMYADLWGLRERDAEPPGGSTTKFAWLLRHTPRSASWTELTPLPPAYLLVPYSSEQADEFTRGRPITECFDVLSTGVKTHRDHFAIAIDEAELHERIEVFRSRDIDDETVRADYRLPDTRDWVLGRSRERLRIDTAWRRGFTRLLMSPFDARPYFHHDSVVELPRSQTSDPLVEARNIALLWTRPLSPTYEFSVFVTRYPAHQCAVGNKMAGAGATYCAPALVAAEAATLRASQEGDHSDPLEQNTRVDAMAALLQSANRLGDNNQAFAAVHAMYGQLSSPGYRDRYQESLKREVPRLFTPLATSLAKELERLGADLVALHTLDDDYEHASWNLQNIPSPLSVPLTTFHDDGDREVRKVGEKGKTMVPSPDYGEGFGRVYINDSAYFDGVPEAVWNFHIGGYQVCHKWLKDRQKKGGKNPRPGRILTGEDLTHYQKIVVALNETIRLMAEIDEVIESHGGWPGAFVTEKQN